VTDHPERRAGIMLVRVWLEAPAPKGLRARLIGISDLSLERETSAASSVDEVCDQVRAWLEAFVAGR
jgi:hypothetical protein